MCRKASVPCRAICLPIPLPFTTKPSRGIVALGKKRGQEKRKFNEERKGKQNKQKAGKRSAEKNKMTQKK